MKEELEQLRKELNERIDAVINKQKPLEFSKGWNYVKCEFKWLLLNPIINKDKVYFELAFDLDNNVLLPSDYLCPTSGLKSHRPATPKEIKSCLVKHCESLGMKEGAVVNSVKFQNYEWEMDRYKPHYDEVNDEMYMGGCCVYKQGKFAKVVKDDVIKIGGYEVKFNKTSETTIDGFRFTKEFWEAAKIISKHSKAKIMVGCSKQFDVSLETINKILFKL